MTDPIRISAPTVFPTPPLPFEDEEEEAGSCSEIGGRKDERSKSQSGLLWGSYDSSFFGFRDREARPDVGIVQEPASRRSKDHQFGG